MDATVEPMDALEMDVGEMSDDEMDETDGEAGHTGFMIARLPNEQARTTFTVPADASGEYEIGCFGEEGVHWDEGRRAG